MIIDRIDVMVGLILTGVGFLGGFLLAFIYLFLQKNHLLKAKERSQELIKQSKNDIDREHKKALS